jgi:hypothetical protein
MNRFVNINIILEYIRINVDMMHTFLYKNTQILNM